MILGLGLSPLCPWHRADQVRRNQRTIRRVPNEHGVALGDGDESGHRCEARPEDVHLIVAGDDLDIEVTVLTVCARDPVGVEVLDSPRLITRSGHTAVIAEFEVAETPDARLGQCPLA